MIISFLYKQFVNIFQFYCYITAKYDIRKLRGNIMKKALEFIAMPLAQITAGIIGFILAAIISLSVLYCAIYILLSVILYAASGYILSKIESKKTKVLSAITSALIIAIALIAIYISAQAVNTDNFYIAFFISPFTYAATFLTGLMFEHITKSEILIFSVLTLICSICPVAITLIFEKIFKKTARHAKQA